MGRHSESDLLYVIATLPDTLIIPILHFRVSLRIDYYNSLPPLTAMINDISSKLLFDWAKWCNIS